MMTGWKTWVAALAMIALGIVDIVNGQSEQGVMKVVAALGMVGIGHKIEKAAAKKDE